MENKGTKIIYYHVHDGIYIYIIYRYAYTIGTLSKRLSVDVPHVITSEISTPVNVDMAALMRHSSVKLITTVGEYFRSGFVQIINGSRALNTVKSLSLDF